MVVEDELSVVVKPVKGEELNGVADGFARESLYKVFLIVDFLASTVDHMGDFVQVDEGGVHARIHVAQEYAVDQSDCTQGRLHGSSYRLTILLVLSSAHQ